MPYELLVWDPKDPQEEIDYTVTWIKRLGEDVIASSTWEFADDADGELEIMVSPAASFTDTATKLWLSGGTAGKTYRLTNKIVTGVTRKMEQGVILRVINK